MYFINYTFVRKKGAKKSFMLKNNVLGIKLKPK